MPERVFRYDVRSADPYGVFVVCKDADGDGAYRVGLDDERVLLAALELAEDFSAADPDRLYLVTDGAGNTIREIKGVTLAPF